MLTVVQILYSGLGGQASVFFSLAEADLLHQPDSGTASLAEHHVVFYGREALVEDYADKCQQLGIPFRYWRKGPGFDLWQQWQIAKHVASLTPDVFIVHSPQWMFAGRLVKMMCGQCTVVAVEHHPNMLKTRGKWWLSAMIPRLADSVVYLTRTYQQQVASRIGRFYRPSRARIIPNGVNISRFCPVASYPAEGHVIGMASRLSDQKDIETLLKAFALLKVAHPERPLTLRLAGDGPHRESLQSLSATLELTDAVVFDGMLTEQEMVDFYQSLTVYVHATRSETMSTSVVQALSCGLPVIASDIPGMSDILPTDTVDRSLVPVGGVDAMCTHLSDLLSDADTLRSLARVSRQHAERELSSQVALHRYLEAATEKHKN